MASEDVLGIKSSRQTIAPAHTARIIGAIPLRIAAQHRGTKAKVVANHETPQVSSCLSAPPERSCHTANRNKFQYPA